MRRLLLFLALSWVVLGIASPVPPAPSAPAAAPGADRALPVRRAASVAAARRAPWVSPVGEPVRVARPFRPPALRWSAGHRGVDLAAGVDSVVRAAGPGRVSFAGRLAGRGVVVVVHRESRTTYEPVTATVRVGDRVAAGAPIGRLAAGHDPARPRVALLHWGLLRGRTYLDPMSLLRGRPVRLLPHWDEVDHAGAGIGPRGARVSEVDADDRAPDDRRSPPREADGGSTSTTRLSSPMARPRARTATVQLVVAMGLVGAAALAGYRRVSPSGR